VFNLGFHVFSLKRGKAGSRLNIECCQVQLQNVNRENFSDYQGELKKFNV
jgi:hypothetical protein